MDTSLFLEQFGHLAQSPKGIQKLRVLVLDLAVRGKLVSQNSDDEPASELFTRINAQKRQFIRAGKVKDLEEFPPINKDKIPYDIPQSWEFVRLGSVVQNERGITFPASAKETHATQENIACLRTTNIQSEVEWGDLIYVSQDYVTHHEKIIQVGDILISLANSRELVGKTAIVRSIPIEKATLGGFIGAIRPFVISPEYVNYFLSSSATRIYFISEANQTTNIANISTGKLNLTPFPLPPLAEQHRIVAKVDKLMQLCDQLEEEQVQRERLQEHAAKSTLHHLTSASSKSEALNYWQHAEQHFSELFDRISTVEELRSTILQLAVQGRLVPQNPDDEPAGELLMRIELEKQQLIKAGEIKKSDPLPRVGSDERLYELPQGWEWVRLGKTILQTSSGWSPQCLPRMAASNEWGVLKVSAISWNKFDPLENKALPSDIVPREEFAVKRNDFLVSRANTEELVGKAVVVEGDYPKLLLSDKTVKIEFTTEIDLRYALLVVNSENSRKYYKDVASGTSSSMKNISRQHILNIPLPLPPVLEQHRIVTKVDELMRLCDQLQEEATQSRELSARLVDSIIYHLFEPVVAT